MVLFVFPKGEKLIHTFYADEAQFKGSIIADGPVIVQGVDVLKEINENKKSIETLIKTTEDLDSYLQYLKDNLTLEEPTKNAFSEAIKQLKEGAEITGVLTFVIPILLGLNPTNLAIAGFVLSHKIYQQWGGTDKRKNE